MILYHGSNVTVQEPQILENGFYKDHYRKTGKTLGFDKT